MSKHLRIMAAVVELDPDRHIEHDSYDADEDVNAFRFGDVLDDAALAIPNETMVRLVCVWLTEGVGITPKMQQRVRRAVNLVRDAYQPVGAPQDSKEREP